MLRSDFYVAAYGGRSRLWSHGGSHGYLGFSGAWVLGVESVRGAAGLGITVSYWESEDALREWKAHSEHQVAQGTGKRVWYADYVIRVAKVERTYGKASSPTNEPLSL
jgi:heme-degrading monooxygenase HmoA